MRLFLIRHGETVDNVAGIYAGVRDSALTNHGVLQANRLGAFFVNRKVIVSALFSSDLQRAFKTADAVRLALESVQELGPVIEVQTSVLLREQDFGFYEGKKFFERAKESNKSGKDAHLEAHKNDPGFVDVESKEAMNARCDRFIDENLVPLCDDTKLEQAIVVVAHGIILSHLWRCVLRRFPTRSVSVVPGAVPADRALTLEHLGGWSNTGYLELELSRQTTSLLETEVAAQIGPPPSSTKDKNVDNVQIPQTMELATLRESSDSESVSILVARLDDETTVREGKKEGVTNRDTIDGFSMLEHPSTTMPSSPVRPLPASPRSKLIRDMSLTVKAVNCVDHLIGLKKTRGGIGNLKYDAGQKSIESFFTKKRKLE